MTYGTITLTLRADNGAGIEVELSTESMTTKPTFHRDLDHALINSVAILKAKLRELREPS